MSFLDKVCGKLGLMDTMDGEDEIKDSPLPTENMSELKHKKPVGTASVTSSTSNVINMPKASVTAVKQSVKVVVVEPFSFDDAQHIADHLKNHKPVVINFENTDQEVARRMIDFISGTIYALAGNIKKVGNNIFLCAPSNIDVSYTPKHEDESDIVMPWLNK